MPHDFTTKPDWAAYIWTDDNSINIQLPCPLGKAPVLVQYQLTEGGLAKALTLVKQCAHIKGKGPAPGWYKHSLPEIKVKHSLKPSTLEHAPQGLLDALKEIIK